MATVTALVRVLAWLFPHSCDYTWLSREMNLNLPQELDFSQEATNIHDCTSLLHDLIQRGDVCVPSVLGAASSSRVLTMSFEEGAYVTDLHYLQAHHLQPAHVAQLVSTLFCQQIFNHGFVHCGESISLFHCSVIALTVC